MDKERRKELIAQFKEMKTYMGVVQIKNTVDSKAFVTSSRNLKNQWLTWKQQLEMGRFMNLALQADWTNLGADAFIYEVLEEIQVDEADSPIVNQRKLKDALNTWLDKVRPYGNQGYNKEK